MNASYAYLRPAFFDSDESRARRRVALQAGFADSEVDAVVDWMHSHGWIDVAIANCDPAGLEEILDRFC